MSNNYKKVFFCLPIRTQMNMFLSYLVIAILVIFPTTILSNDNISHLTEKESSWNFNKYVITRFIPHSEINDGDYISYLDLNNHDDVIIPSESMHVEEENDPGVGLDQMDPSPIIEAKPSKIFPLGKYQQTKQTYKENVQKFQVKNDKQLHISQPTFTDFGVVRGYRSFEEVIAVGSKSKKVIERCLERYFRIHPRFRGKIIVKFDVHPDGYIIDKSLQIVYSDIAYEPTLQSIRKSILRWVSYPAVPQESGIYSVTQKYIF